MDDAGLFSIIIDRQRDIGRQEILMSVHVSWIDYCSDFNQDQSVVFVDQDSGLKKRLGRGIGEDSLSKAVSKNITMILEDLLKDYDKTERPSYNEGQIL